jgi:signal transduction histidine kinase/CheY-like chemotaxis protein
MEQLMVDLLPGLRLVVIAAFAGLALFSVAAGRRTGIAGRWAGAALGAMALALLAGRASDVWIEEVPAWLDNLRLVVLLATPYLLLRFTASFQRLPRWLEVAAALAALTAVTATLVTPPLPAASGARPAWVRAYLLLGLGYWVGASLVTVVRLWGAGSGQPGAVRRRMRLMSVATAALSVALLLAAQLRGAGSEIEFSVQLIGLVSVAAFGLGLHPPLWLRLSWRQEEERELLRAMIAVLRSTTVAGVAAELLPPTTRIIGGAGAAVIETASQEVVASFGQAPEPGRRRSDHDLGRAGATTLRVVPLADGRDELVVWTSPYTPFFGQDEVALLQAMGSVASLALERVRLSEDERRQRETLEEAHRTAEEARDEAARANTAKSEFLSRMSHELRTPLNAILGFGQLLETTETDEDSREWTGHIMKAGRHLLALINDVLDLSRIEAGTMTMSPEPVHTGELIGDTIDLIRPAADSRSIRLTTELTGGDVYVTTDRQRCRQVLLNLLSNAVKYNHDGGSVEISCGSGEDGFLRVAVADTGPGIEPARHDQLFQPFERLGADTSAVEGTGLGLALSKQLVERMGGSIGFDSTPGQGTTFWIDLPAAETPAQPDGPEERREIDQKPTAGISLLLIEDNLANLRVVEAMLRLRPGITILPAMQGGLGIDLAREHRPDVIVLDLHLPDLPGREVLHRLQADPVTRGIPVVIASADASQGRIRQLRDEGAFDYITKPLDLHDFLAVVDAAVEQVRPPAGSDPEA